VQARLARPARQLGVDRQPGDPRELFARKDQRPGVPVFARYTGVDEDVLQLARAAAAERPHAQPRSAEPEAQGKTRPEVRRVTVVTGEMFAPFLRGLLADLAVPGLDVELVPIANEWFGRGDGTTCMRSPTIRKRKPPGRSTPRPPRPGSAMLSMAAI